MTPDPRSVEEFERAVWTLFDFARAVKALGQPPTDDQKKRDAWLRDLWAAAATVPDEGGTTELENFGRDLMDTVGDIQTVLANLQREDERQKRLYATNPVPAFQFVASVSDSLNRVSINTGVAEWADCGCYGAATIAYFYRDVGIDGQAGWRQMTTAYYVVTVSAQDSNSDEVEFLVTGSANYS